MTHHLSFAGLAHQRQGGAIGSVIAAAVALFMLGFAAGAMVRSVATPQSSVAAAPTIEPVRPTARVASNASRLEQQLAYPAEVLRVIDGDTFEARVHVWPGLEVTTKVRLRHVDAPELHARCTDEQVKAEAARTALQNLLAAGEVTISRVGIDKYGGRVDALVATRDTADVSAALLNGGFARAYEGGRRAAWC